MYNIIYLLFYLHFFICQGSNLAFALTIENYVVSIGNGFAELIQLTDNLLTVQPPKLKPAPDFYTNEKCENDGSLAVVVRSSFDT